LVVGGEVDRMGIRIRGDRMSGRQDDRMDRLDFRVMAGREGGLPAIGREALVGG